MVVKRSTTTRDRDRARIRRSKAPCGICKLEIDYKLHYLDPKAFVVDHIEPLSLGGSDAIENKQAAHRDCNAFKSDKMPEEMAALGAPRTFVTSRAW